MMLGIGYCAGALAPLVIGALRDSTGSFHLGLWLIAASALGVLAACLTCSPARLARGIRGPA
jgi:cyanate permease